LKEKNISVTKINGARIIDLHTAIIATDEGLVKWNFFESQIEFLLIDGQEGSSDALECVMNDDVAVFYMRNHRDIHIVDISAFKKAISFKVNNVRLELCALIEPNGKAPKLNDQVVASPLLQFLETGAIPMNPSIEETC
jgi:hypothetical protein